MTLAIPEPYPDTDLETDDSDDSDSDGDDSDIGVHNRSGEAQGTDCLREKVTLCRRSVNLTLTLILTPTTDPPPI